MPIYEFQCQSCGIIIDDFFKLSDEDPIPEEPCPMRCKNYEWKKLISVPQRSQRVMHDSTFPQLTHMRDLCIDTNPDGTKQLGSKRVWAKSRAHLEQLMKERDLVFYEESSEKSAQETKFDMPLHVKKFAESHPAVRKYMDQKKQGLIPETMVLDDDQLKERFDVDDIL